MTRPLLPLLALALGACAVDPDPISVDLAAAAAPACGEPIAFPPEAHPYGRDMVDWSQSWWSWVYGIPAAVNPELDPTADCDVHQRGPVFILPSVLDPGGVASFARTCTLPAGKAILVSPGGVLNDYPCPDPTFQPAPGQSLYDFLLQGAEAIVDHVNGMSVVLDGHDLADPFAYRFHSRHVFTFTGDGSLTNTFDGCVTGAPQAGVSDGYFMMLRPLRAGTHHLSIRSQDSGGTDVTIDWTLIVAGGDPQP